MIVCHIPGDSEYEILLRIISAFELPFPYDPIYTHHLLSLKTLFGVTSSYLFAVEETGILRDLDIAGLRSVISTLQANTLSNTQLFFQNQNPIEFFDQAWLNVLNFPQEWLNVAKPEGAYLLKNYLYVNELMVRCKEAAVRVSPQVWQGIEERMLTVKDEG